MTPLGRPLCTNCLPGDRSVPFVRWFVGLSFDIVVDDEGGGGGGRQNQKSYNISYSLSRQTRTAVQCSPLEDHRRPGRNVRPVDSTKSKTGLSHDSLYLFKCPQGTPAQAFKSVCRWMERRRETGREQLESATWLWFVAEQLNTIEEEEEELSSPTNCPLVIIS